MKSTTNINHERNLTGRTGKRLLLLLILTLAGSAAAARSKTVCVKKNDGAVEDIRKLAIQKLLRNNTAQASYTGSSAANETDTTSQSVESLLPRDPMTGLWKMNVEKSTVRRSIQSRTILFIADGEYVYEKMEQVDTDGKVSIYETNFKWDGTEHPNKRGLFGATTVSYRRINLRTTEIIYRKDSQILVTARSVISPDARPERLDRVALMRQEQRWGRISLFTRNSDLRDLRGAVGHNRTRRPDRAAPNRVAEA